MTDSSKWPSQAELKEQNDKAGSLTDGPFPFEHRIRFLRPLDGGLFQDVIRTHTVTHARKPDEQGSAAPWSYQDEHGSIFRAARDGEKPDRSYFDPNTFEVHSLVRDAETLKNHE